VGKNREYTYGKVVLRAFRGVDNFFVGESGGKWRKFVLLQ
jgi:hypothetical protein